MRSEQEIQLLETGPFPGRMDLWAEHEHFFHSLHEQMIGQIVDTLRRPLLQQGYVIGREMSLQIVESRIHDVFIHQEHPTFDPGKAPYEIAATEILAEAGVLVTDTTNMTAVLIYKANTHQLTTVIELVSPANKDRDQYIQEYELRREKLYLSKGVNVLEIDITRSSRRLVTHPWVSQFPYHVAIFLAGEGLRLVGMNLSQAFKRIAIPLRGQVLPLNVQEIYEKAYQQLGLAALINQEGRYISKYLPFSSLLTDQQRHEALEAVRLWHDELMRVRQS